MQTSFRFLQVSSNRENNGSCSNLVPRALFPGFGGGPGKSATGRQEEEDGKTAVCDKRDKAITCGFCRDLHLTPRFSGPLQKDLFKGK